VSKEADTGEGGKGAVPDSADMPDRDRRQEADTGTLSAGQAATALGVSERSVRRYIASGRLPAARVHGPKGVEYRIELADVEAMAGRAAALEARSVPADEGADMDRPVSMSAGAGLQTMQAVLEPLARELAAYRAELIASRTERERLQETIADKDATIERQAEDLGAARERARRAQAEADQVRAQLQAYTQAEQEKRETEAYAQARALLAQSHARQRAEWKALHRPWWAFWRPGPPRPGGQDDQ